MFARVPLSPLLGCLCCGQPTAHNDRLPRFLLCFHGAMEQRLQKILSRAGVASRRKAEELILAGRVTVDGRPASLGQRADPERQIIAVDGTPIPWPPPQFHIALNKPRGFLSTREDPHAGRTVFELLPEDKQAQLVMVGRLDRDSEGVVIFTTDGELAHRLMHPRYRVPRVYRVLVEGDPRAVGRVRAGVQLQDGPARPERAEIVKRSGRRFWVEMVLREGRKREVRRICAAVGWRVLRLVRIAYGPVRLGRLPAGQWRELKAAEVRALRKLVGLGELHRD